MTNTCQKQETQGEAEGKREGDREKGAEVFLSEIEKGDRKSSKDGRNKPLKSGGQGF